MSIETSPPAPAPVPEAAPVRRCQNCGEVLLGEHCYACGQPTKGLVRHFSSIIGDFMDSVFELDSRILRTLGPLLFKPGYLTLEYFAGRRVRYVSPVRLFVFLSLFAFFASRLSFDIDREGVDVQGEGLAVVDVDESRNRGLRNATTVEEVERIRDEALAALGEARKETANVPGAGIGMDVARQGVINEAERRIKAIRHSEATGEPLPVVQENDGTISFNGTPWHAEDNPVNVAWLPDAVNKKINDSAGDAQANMKRIQQDPNLLKDAFLSTVPTTLFVLLPLFALLLKIAYVFKRRLYMEHLIVALHSHAFLCGSLLVVLVLDALATWTAALPWLSLPLGWAETALLVWMPVYLLLMQKRVYAQGWLMTLFKYCVLGTCYFMLLSFGAAGSLLVSLVVM
ncbi:DUF3667 domain-containing protein [Arenimonas sp. MALMAid1274]|uniref:DUF3667 domain-containing protein n=1 Tax=Arenimonas sp. MALMAid1274 TaxID=3411630 RepID=UPI003B9FDF31